MELEQPLAAHRQFPSHRNTPDTVAFRREIWGINGMFKVKMLTRFGGSDPELRSIVTLF
jgi:hypothetical protein